mmetsp:Transcript_1813/g.5938  ORF Transcript_1813/g.5938 Transcript_1813/m.5938 type:complete len:226 (-) Transcript_1813:822-1499(-)
MRRREDARRVVEVRAEREQRVPPERRCRREEGVVARPDLGHRRQGIRRRHQRHVLRRRREGRGARGPAEVEGLGPDVLAARAGREKLHGDPVGHFDVERRAPRDDGHAVGDEAVRREVHVVDVETEMPVHEPVPVLLEVETVRLVEIAQEGRGAVGVVDEVDVVRRVRVRREAHARRGHIIILAAVSRDELARFELRGTKVVRHELGGALRRRRREGRVGVLHRW